MEARLNSDFLGMYFTVDEFLIVLAAMAGTILLLMILLIVNIVKTGKLKKRYKAFMEGKDGQSLEEILMSRIDQIEALAESEKENRDSIHKIFENMEITFQKVGMVKYDAFQEMGGKLSFSLALLNKKNDGFIINAMHSREGCYTYIKEIIDGNSFIALAQEEKEALDIAMGVKDNTGK